MDCDELFEHEVEEVIDDDDHHGAVDDNDVNADEVSDEDTGVEDGGNSEGNEPVRDDSALIFSKHEGSVFCCHLEPKTGELAVTGGQDDMAYVWETCSGDIVLHCKGHQDSVICAQFSHDGSYVATGDMKGVLQVWKIASKLKVLEADICGLTWLQWHHGANVLLAASEIGEVYMWRIPGGECKLLPQGHEQINCGIILPDGRRAAVGFEDGAVKVVDLKSGTVLHHLPKEQAHTGPVTCMDCHPDNNLLITGSVDGHALILKTQTGKVAVVLDCKGPSLQTQSIIPAVEAVGFSRDTSFPVAVTGSGDGTLCIWDVSRGTLRHRLQEDLIFTKLVWVKNSPNFYTADTGGTIRLYDARSGSLQKQLFGHSDCILDVSCSRDFSTIVTASDDGTARIFSVQPPD